MGDHPVGQVCWPGAAPDGARPYLDLPGDGVSYAGSGEITLVHQIEQSLVGQGFGRQDFAAVLDLQAQAASPGLVSQNAEVADGLEPIGAPGETSEDATDRDAAVSTG